MMEVQAGEMAREKASAAAVKEYAERMVNEHGKANEELKTLANEKGVTLPSELGDQEREKLQRLNNQSGAEFDRAYLDLMEQDHQEALQRFRNAAENADDSDLKSFASQTAGVIEQHLNSAKQLQAQERPESTGSQHTGNTREGSMRGQEQGSMRDRDSGTSQGSAREKNEDREKNTSRDRDSTRDRDSRKEERRERRDSRESDSSGASR